MRSDEKRRSRSVSQDDFPPSKKNSKKRRQTMSSSSSSSSSSCSREPSRKSRKDAKKRRKSQASSSSHDSSSSCSSSSSSSEASVKKRKHKKRKKSTDKKKKKKEKKRQRKAKKKEKKRLKKIRRKSLTLSIPEVSPGPSMASPKTPDLGLVITCGAPEWRCSSKRVLKPMTREEWEAQQSVVRRVVDPQTGRERLVKGDGEIIEEIVSRERQKEINKQATSGDAAFYALKAGISKF